MNKGFTLIELLAVIVILAIILLIAVPQVLTVIDDAKQGAYESSLEMIEEASLIYAASNSDSKSVSITTLVSEGYLDETPVDVRDNSDIDGVVAIYNGTTDYKAGYNGTCNKPEIIKNMYPVYWNDNNWVVTTEDDDNWYLYNGDIDNSADADKNNGIGAFTVDKWANAQVTTEKLNVGDIVNESDLNLYVWIPRYTYLLDESSKTVQIKYTNIIDDDNSSNYLSHPGFTFGEEELTGIWVAKFEMSADDQSITSDYGDPSSSAIGVSRPNAKSWRNTSVNDIFLEARTLEVEYSLNGDSHMMKSAEWGAAAYLTEAIRDGEEVWINNQGWYDGTNTTNNYKYITTGCAGTSKSAYDNNATSVGCPSGYSYSDLNGMKASTTGNIYGIYDMVGGSWEYMSTYINDNTSSRLTSTSYAKALADADSKYKEMFDIQGTSDTTNYSYTSELTQGLAIHETSTSGTGASGWYSDYSCFLYAGYPVVLRGGGFYSGSSAGMFAFSRNSGGASLYSGWRAVLSL